MDAIIEDRVEFVQLILQQNVVMKEFLTRKRMMDLYERVKVIYIHLVLKCYKNK